MPGKTIPSSLSALSGTDILHDVEQSNPDYLVQGKEEHEKEQQGLLLLLVIVGQEMHEDDTC